jgi:hypothetical protein
MALVVTLALMLLVTILVFAFFTVMTANRSLQTSRASQIEAELLAQTASDYVAGQFLKEIETRSTNVTVAGGAARLFLPLDSAGMVPLRTVSAAAASSTNFPTLVRQSIDSADTNASTHASSVPSKNSRVLSPLRWNAPRLTLGDGFTTNTVPAWIYVSAAGGPGSAPGPETIGRFAYNVYDVGGLLDINAAGHPETLFAGSARPKDTLAGAALRQSDVNVSVGALMKLMQFRSPADLTDREAFLKNARAFAGEGFLQTVASATEAGTVHSYTNNFFYDRQDLIRFARTLAPDSSLASALPFLTTYSRSVAGPVWSPARNSPDFPSYFAAAQSASPHRYADEAMNADAVNPAILPFAFTTPAEIRHYGDDGVLEKFDPSLSYSYRAEAGTPVVHRRFSLAKLAWLGPDGPNAEAFHPSLSAAERAEAIRACFGLTWDDSGAFPKWVYQHGNASKILTLDEVRQAGRPPDFFELLKAVILHGSLGRHPGPGGAPDTGDASSPVSGVRFDEIYRHADGQILQIGANTIDQADADSFPTAISSGIPLQSFSNPDVFSETSREFFQTIMGVENIPFIFRIWNPILTSGGTRVRGWWWPEVWNPHRKPVVTGGPRPSAYRIRAFGTSRTQTVFDVADNLYNGPDDNLSEEIDHENDPRGFVEFVDSGNFYDQPRRLQVDVDDFPGSTTEAINKWSSSEYPEQSLKFLGIFAGEVIRPEPVKDTLMRLAPHKGGDAYFNPRSTFPDVPVSLLLEYRDANGAWRPASLMARFNRNYRNTTRAVAGGVLSTTFYDSVVRSCLGKLDPRTDRFASSGSEQQKWGYGAQLWRASGTPAGSGRPFYLPAPATGIVWSGGVDDRAKFGEYARNLSSLPGFYSDPDGVVRPGDGARTDLATDDGNPILLGTNTGTHTRRPVILDRPFQSVGELGVVFRDSPMRTIDFWTRDSADAGLLDVFAVRDEPRVGAGKVNLNAAPAPVLKALLLGGAKHALDPAVPPMSATEVNSVANALVPALRQAPLKNIADLVAEHGDVIAGSLSTSFRANKTLAEAPVRALAEVSSVRTWTFLVDIVAQSGRFSGTGTGPGDFMVEGEKRLWVHVAIDRFTGEIVGMQTEAVYE